jgi:hypothetical protein
VLNFTLYGSPAPRYSQRISSAVGRAKPRRQFTKPTSCPPASPRSTSSADELQLDLLSLAADEEDPTIVSNGSEVYYTEIDTIVGDLSCKYKDATKSTLLGSDSNRGTNINCANQSSWCEEIDTDDFGNIQRPREEFGTESEDKRNEDPNLLRNADSSNTESEASGTGQNFSDNLSSNHGSDEEQTGSTKSYTRSSSYLTLSEYSDDSCSSPFSATSRDIHKNELSRCSSSRSSVRPISDLANGFKHSNKITKCRQFTIPVGGTRKCISPNKFQQVVSSLHNGNLRHNPESSEHYKTPTEKSLAAINNLCTAIESRVSVSSSGKDSFCASSLAAVNTGTELQIREHSDDKSNACISVPESTGKENEEPVNFLTSSAFESWYDGIATAAESSVHACCELNEVDDNIRYGCGNQYIAKCEADDENINDNANSNSEICGHYRLSNRHRTAKTEERPIEGQTRTDLSSVCCAESMKICSYHTNGFILKESNNRPIHDSDICTISDDCPRKDNFFEELPEIIRVIGMELSANKASEETGFVSSNLNSPTTSCNYISPTDFERYERFDNNSDNSTFKYQQLISSNNGEVQRNVNFPPVGCCVADRTKCSSAVTSDCDCKGTKKPSVKLPECRYFSDDSAPEVFLTAGDALEAVLYARKILCVLERALGKAMSSTTDRNNTGFSLREPSTSLSAKITSKKERPRSLSPKVLRHCNGTDSAYSQTKTETCSDRDPSALGADTGAGNMKGANTKKTLDVKSTLSCDGVFVRGCCYRDASPFLSLSPEQLRKQRALLKPAADRRIQGDVVQMLDMADILRNAIRRRRTFMDPTDELICGTNRSVSEWSLENA